MIVLGVVVVGHLLERRGLAYFFFFNDTATTEIYTLSLHDALPISQADILFLPQQGTELHPRCLQRPQGAHAGSAPGGDRKSTRLNSSHGYISYAVFCLKKKNSCITLSLSTASVSTARIRK